MIELNLLPKELRRKKRKQIEIPRLPFLPIAGAVIGALVVIYVALFIFVGSNNRLSNTLQKKWDQMQPQREKTEKIAREINALERRVTAVRKIVKPDLDWARLLSGLNEAVIPNVWLSEFNLTHARAGELTEEIPLTLNLTGYAVGKSEVAMSTVGKFMESLKKNNDFFKYFDEIELQHIKNAVIAEQEVMLFKLICNFKRAEPVKKEPEKTSRKRRRRR